MESLVRLFIGIFLIGSIAFVIIFFTLFGVLPAEQVTEALRGERSSSTDPTVVYSTTTIIERIFTEGPSQRPDESATSTSTSTPSEPTEPEGPSGPDTPSTPSEPEVGETAPGNFSIAVNQGILEPKILETTIGTNVTITIQSLDTTYVISIPDLGLSQTVSPRQRKVMIFQALQAGEFDITCDECEVGITGILRVTSP